MRLEQLFQQMDHFLNDNTVWDNRAVISSLLDILAIFSRNDLKKEILKELDRHSNILSQVSENQDVDLKKLEQILKELEHISNELYAYSGKIGRTLMENELFKSISQRSSIPGGTCAFDLPEYHFWLIQPQAQRQQDLLQWLSPFETIRKAMDLILRFIRQSTVPTSEIAQAGFFQQALDRNLSFQLLRVSVDKSLPYFAEISGGKHRFSIRFMEAGTSNRPTQTDQDIAFALTRCLF